MFVLCVSVCVHGVTCQADPKMPKSRKLLAVPFVGKDVPSRASEFSHPDVVIGECLHYLTVLGSRFVFHSLVFVCLSFAFFI